MSSKRENPWYRVLKYGLEYLGRYYSSYPGFVVDTEDPDNRNRLRVAVPAVHGESVSPVLALPIGQWGGKDYGVQMLPRVGDLVWVSFSNGDPRSPFWQHGSYAVDEKPEEFSHNKVYGFKTPKGNIILINDQEDEDSTDSYIEIIHHLNGKIKILDKAMLFETDEFKTSVKDALIEATNSVTLGSNATQPVVKGTILETHINNILTQNSISGIFVGAAFIPIANAAAFAALQSQTNLIKSTKVKTE